MARPQCETTLVFHCGAGKLHSFLDATQKSHFSLFLFHHLGDIIIPCAWKKLSFFSMQKAKSCQTCGFLNAIFERKKVATLP
jgi:hypothetical protein